MLRTATQKLRLWREKCARENRPLVLSGARRVGKTWLLKDFGASDFRKTLYINFEEEPTLAHCFDYVSGSLNLLHTLEKQCACQIDADTLVIFDEVQLCPSAFMRMKTLTEAIPSLRLAAAGSLMGVAFHPGTSYPSNAISIKLYPLDFDEFLLANNQENLLKKVAGEERIASSDHLILKKWYENYLLVGGMPQCVITFAETGNINSVREEQQQILTLFERDFTKHVSNAETTTRLRELWRSIPAQLVRRIGSRRFSFKCVRKGASKKEYDMSLMWLEDCGLVILVNKNEEGKRTPLILYDQNDIFRVHLLDTGLLQAILTETLQTSKKASADWQGIMAEQFAAQELFKTAYRQKLRFWSNDTYEVDFLLELEEGVIPLEIKSGESCTSKSLSFFCKKYNPPFSIVASLAEVNIHDKIKHIPLYSLGHLKTFIKSYN